MCMKLWLCNPFLCSPWWVTVDGCHIAPGMVCVAASFLLRPPRFISPINIYTRTNCLNSLYSYWGETDTSKMQFTSNNLFTVSTWPTFIGFLLLSTICSFPDHQLFFIFCFLCLSYMYGAWRLLLLCCLLHLLDTSDMIRCQFHHKISILNSLTKQK